MPLNASGPMGSRITLAADLPAPVPTRRRRWPWVLLAVVLVLIVAGTVGPIRRPGVTAPPGGPPPDE